MFCRENAWTPVFVNPKLVHPTMKKMHSDMRHHPSSVQSVRGTARDSASSLHVDHAPRIARATGELLDCLFRIHLPQFCRFSAGLSMVRLSMCPTFASGTDFQFRQFRMRLCIISGFEQG